MPRPQQEWEYAGMDGITCLRELNELTSYGRFDPSDAYRRIDDALDQLATMWDLVPALTQRNAF